MAACSYVRTYIRTCMQSLTDDVREREDKSAVEKIERERASRENEMKNKRKPELRSPSTPEAKLVHPLSNLLDRCLF